MLGQRWALWEMLGEEVAERNDGRVSRVEDGAGCMVYVPQGFRWIV